MSSPDGNIRTDRFRGMPWRLYRRHCGFLRNPYRDSVNIAVVLQRNTGVLHLLVVQLDDAGIAGTSSHRDLICRAGIPVRDFKSAPIIWNHRSDGELIAAPLEPQHFLDPDPIHPAGRARIPGPTGSSQLSRRGGYVGCDYVRLATIAFHSLRIAAALHRTHHIEQAHGSRTFA